MKVKPIIKLSKLKQKRRMILETLKDKEWSKKMKARFKRKKSNKS